MKAYLIISGQHTYNSIMESVQLTFSSVTYKQMTYPDYCVIWVDLAFSEN